MKNSAGKSEMYFIDSKTGTAHKVNGINHAGSELECLGFKTAALHTEPLNEMRSFRTYTQLDLL